MWIFNLTLGPPGSSVFLLSEAHLDHRSAKCAAEVRALPPTQIPTEIRCWSERGECLFSWQAPSPVTGMFCCEGILCIVWPMPEIVRP